MPGKVEQTLLKALDPPFSKKIRRAIDALKKMTAGDSDLLAVYNAYCAWKRTRRTPGINKDTFYRKNFLSSQTLLNIEDITMQLVISIADTGLLKLDPT
ncbi:hypothetical protein ATERTT37_002427 [Aspergillus terreus]